LLEHAAIKTFNVVFPNDQEPKLFAILK